MKEYYKLVRDNIIDIMKEDNEIPNYHILKKSEYEKCLRSKLIEEGMELLNAKSRDDIIEEIADVYEVLYAIVSLKKTDIDTFWMVVSKQNVNCLLHKDTITALFKNYLNTMPIKLTLSDIAIAVRYMRWFTLVNGISDEEVSNVKEEKKTKKGGFQKKIYLETSL